MLVFERAIPGLLLLFGTGLSPSVSSSNKSAAFPVRAGPDEVGLVRENAIVSVDV